MNGYVDLAIAIISAAKRDYIASRNDHSFIARYTRNEIERFFLSPFGQALTLGNGAEVVKTLQSANINIKGT